MLFDKTPVSKKTCFIEMYVKCKADDINWENGSVPVPNEMVGR